MALDDRDGTARGLGDLRYRTDWKRTGRDSACVDERSAAPSGRALASAAEQCKFSGGPPLEYPARRKLIAAVLCLAAMVLVSPHAHAARAVSFTLSTNRTFSPGEKPTLHLYTHNVYELEFRVYRVKDPVKFIRQLPELHTFGNTSPSERIDEETWLEKFHDWKHHIWYLVRHFFQGQFSEQSRDYFRAKQAS